jgi:GGDEF domain-containing protein
VLRAIGGVLKSTVRQNDLCARFAGDEFVVVLWDCSPDNEARRVQELQTAVGAYPFEPRPGVRVSLSISAGASRFPHDGRTFDELLAPADARMYRDTAAPAAPQNTRPRDLKGPDSAGRCPQSRIRESGFSAPDRGPRAADRRRSSTGRVCLFPLAFA